MGLGLGTGRHGMGHITDECNPSVCAGIVDLVRVRGGVGVGVGVGVRVSGCSGIVETCRSTQEARLPTCSVELSKQLVL